MIKPDKLNSKNIKSIVSVMIKEISDKRKTIKWNNFLQNIPTVFMFLEFQEEYNSQINEGRL